MSGTLSVWQKSLPRSDLLALYHRFTVGISPGAWHDTYALNSRDLLRPNTGMPEAQGNITCFKSEQCAVAHIQTVGVRRL